MSQKTRYKGPNTFSQCNKWGIGVPRSYAAAEEVSARSKRIRELTCRLI